MKVLYLVSGIGPPAGWGTEYIQNEIFELSKKRITATIISPIIKHTQPDWKAWIREQEKTFGVRIIALDPPAWLKAHLLIHFAVTPILVTWVAVRLMQRERFDIVHEFTSTPIIAIRSLIFALLFKTPTVITYSVYNNTFLGRLFWFKLFDFARLIIVQSLEIQDKLHSLGIDRKKLIYCPPAIEVRKFLKKYTKNEARDVLGLPHDKYILSFYSSLTKEKGVIELLNALEMMRKVTKKHILIAMYVVWKGSNENHKLVNHIRSMNLPFLRLEVGFVDIPTLLSASDAVIFPLRTGHGSTIPPVGIIEAHISGRQIIATDTPGVRELLAKMKGVVLPPRDPIALAEAFEVCYRDRSRIKKNFIRDNFSNFNINNVAKILLKTYQSVLLLN